MMKGCGRIGKRKDEGKSEEEKVGRGNKPLTVMPWKM